MFTDLLKTALEVWWTRKKCLSIYQRMKLDSLESFQAELSSGFFHATACCLSFAPAQDDQTEMTKRRNMYCRNVVKD